MWRMLVLWVAAAGLVFPLVSLQAVPLPIHKGKKKVLSPKPEAGRPCSRWSVKFSNGVAEVCTIRNDGTASVAEPLRTSGGKWAVKGGVLVIACADDRIERWTPVGKRFVVEHWFPAAQMATGKPVLGIAGRAR
jgi:hypothetical protein